MYTSVAFGDIGDSASNPKMIHNVAELQAMNNGLSLHYKLAANIDASATTPDVLDDGYSAEGFEPIGTYLTPFTGSFNGAGFTISNLFINRPSTNFVGLIGYTSGAPVDSIGLKDADIVGNNYVGAVVGYSYTHSAITNSFSTGTITGMGDYVGGIAGVSSSSVSNSYSTCSLTVWGNFTGGVVGYIYSSSVNNCYSTSSVTLEGTGTEAGGVVGKNYSSTVTNCFWDIETNGVAISTDGTGKTTAEMKAQNTFTDWNFVDGVWVIDETDHYPRLDWSVKKLTYNSVGGGFVDDTLQYVFNGDSGTVVTAVPNEDCYFISWSDGLRMHSRTDIAINDTTFTALFGVYAKNSHGELLISTLDELQGMRDNLAGEYRLIADIDISATSSWFEEGDGTFAGFEPIGNISTQFTGSLNGAEFTVSNLYINRPGTDYVGLIGYANGAFIDSLGLEGVAITGMGNVGGVVGDAANSSSVSNCYSTGTVTGTSSVGGVVGNAESSSIGNNYSTCSVTGASSVGGVVGDVDNSSSFSNSYSTGTVTGTSSIGGVVGDADPSSTVTNCFWDTETSGVAQSDFGTGKNTAEMKTQDTYTDWDFVDGADDDIWVIDESDDYPRLDWSVKKLSYPAVTGGSVDDTLQYVFNGDSGTAVTAVADAGCYFISWSDGLRTFSRTDIGNNDTTITAIFGVYATNLDGELLISTLDELQGMRDNLDREYRLTANIDVSAATSWYDNGDGTFAGFEPIGNSTTRFTGSLNGTGFTVSNLYINRPSTDYVGLIGFAKGTSIDSLGLIDVAITGRGNVGGVIGYASNSSSVSNSYSTGTVRGTNSVGGVVGETSHSSSVTNSYSTSKVTGTSLVGGVVGDADASSTVTNCFWDTETSGITISDFGMGKTTTEMKTLSTFTTIVDGELTTAWDFNGNPNDDGADDNIWVIDETDDYPRLDWSVKKLTYKTGIGGSVDDTLQYVLNGQDGLPVTAVAQRFYYFTDWNDGITANPRRESDVSKDSTVEAQFKLNSAPVITSDDTVTILEDVYFRFNLEATDAEGDDVTFTVNNLPDWLRLSNSKITGIPLNRDVGEFTLTVRADDGNIETLPEQTLTITVENVNDAPTFDSTNPQDVNEDNSIDITLDMVEGENDIDGDNLVLLVIDGDDDNYSVNGTTVTPDANFFGELYVPVKVSDGTESSSEKILIITVENVNDVPTFDSANPQNINEDNSIDFTLDMVEGENDIDGDNLVLVVIDGDDDNYTVNGSTITPDANFFGELYVPVKVSDGIESSFEKILIITVENVNDAPTFDSATAQTIAEDSVFTLTLDMIVGEVDIENDALTLIVQDSANYSVSGTTITPTANWSGTLTVPVKVNDGSGSSLAKDMRITVTSVIDYDTTAVSSYSVTNLDTFTMVDSTVLANKDTVVTTIDSLVATDTMFVDSIYFEDLISVDTIVDTTIIVDTTLLAKRLDTLVYIPTITVTVVSTHSIVKDTTTSIKFVESGLDTTVTTIRTENTTDSLFIRSDSLSDGVSYWFNIDTSVTLTSVDIDTVVVTVDYISIITETIVSTHSIVRDTTTSIDSIESGLDTIVTTIRTENTTDSLFIRSDSLSDGVSYWFVMDTSVALTSTVIDTAVVILEGATVEIEVIERRTNTEQFLAYPNPVNISSGVIFFTLPQGLSGTGTVKIFDAVGTVLDEQTVSIREGSNLRWDLTNRIGKFVGSGSYVAVLKVELNDGTVQMFRTMVGVRR